MRSVSAVVALLAAAWVSSAGSSGQEADVRELVSRPIVVERGAAVSATPLEVRAGKLFLRGSANGQEREFIFDSGSPSLLTRQFADALGLESVGQNTGVDANGKAVTMDFAVVDTLQVGDVTFRDVPVLIFDPLEIDGGRCFFDGGVIGSEVFPGSAWRIDLGRNKLLIAGSADALGEPVGGMSAPLHDFGYPHAPIFVYGVGEIEDKALFDTGSGAVVSLFGRLLDDPSVKRVMAADTIASGRGYEGVSAGGWGEVVDLVRFDLARLGIGIGELADARATTRAAPPTLLGAGVLDSHVVTLDYPNGRILLDERSAPAAPRPEAGYKIALVGDHAEVVQLYENSAAARAGLKLGDRVAAVQGRSLADLSGEEACAATWWLSDDFDVAAETVVELVRDGERVELVVPGG